MTGRDKLAVDAAEEAIAFLRTCIDALTLAAQGIAVLADATAVDMRPEVRTIGERLVALRARLDQVAAEHADRAARAGLE